MRKVNQSESTGMSAERLARIRPAMERHVGDDKLSGVTTLICRGGEVVYEDSVGLMDRERQLDMRNDAIFRIYSMTKPITCVALMMLYEQGRFRLSDPVSKFIPAFAKLKVHPPGNAHSDKLERLDRDVTIHDLLLHTSGMTYHFSEYGPVDQLYRDTKVVSDQSLEQFVADLTELPLAFQPGTAWRYSLSQDVVAHLVEVLSESSFDDFLSTHLFKPLGMADTGFFVSAEKHDRFAAMYGARDVLEFDATAAAASADANRGVNVLIGDPLTCLESKPHNVLRGGHGLVSTARDYLQFCKMLLNDGVLDGTRLLSRKTVELMSCNHLPPALLPISFEDGPRSGMGYGLGFGVLMDLGRSQTIGSVGEFYWSGAASTSFWIDPSEDLIGIQMAQFQPSGHHLVSDDFKVMAYQAIAD
jgi:CubicO group peptidase (beta-lactamase class C family)